MDKKAQYKIMNFMQQLHPDLYAFHCTSFSLPEDKEEMDEFVASHPDTYIAKPNEGEKGHGIFVFNEPEEYESQKKGDSYAVQRYMANPHLI